MKGGERIMRFIELAQFFSISDFKYVEILESSSGDPIEFKEIEELYPYKVKNMYFYKDVFSIYLDTDNKNMKVKLKKFLKVYNRTATKELKNENVVKLVNTKDHSKFMRLPMYEIPSEYKTCLVENFYFDDEGVINILIPFNMKKKKGKK